MGLLVSVGNTHKFQQAKPWRQSGQHSGKRYYKVAVRLISFPCAGGIWDGFTGFGRTPRQEDEGRFDAEISSPREGARPVMVSSVPRTSTQGKKHSSFDVSLKRTDGRPWFGYLQFFLLSFVCLEGSGKVELFCGWMWSVVI